LCVVYSLISTSIRATYIKRKHVIHPVCTNSLSFFLKFTHGNIAFDKIADEEGSNLVYLEPKGPPGEPDLAIIGSKELS
jgi:hypothetical protein